jgi:putative DNA primase/helicase
MEVVMSEIDEGTQPEEGQTLTHDKEINIATASNRQARKWKNQTIKISEFVQKLGKTVRTHETFNEYRNMAKNDQDRIKDIGGYVGGILKDGLRRKNNVQNRQLLTYDIDFGKPGTIDKIKKDLKRFCFTISGTHKHTAKRPRFRLIVYPDRPMTNDEFVAVARKIASNIDIEVFDDGSYDVNRLLYWPSTSEDGEFVFYHNDKGFLPVDKVLLDYGDDDEWKDTTLWPRSSRETKAFDRLLKKQADPLGKKGVVGAFCRTVPLKTALAEYLGDIYKKESEGRYTYMDGSGSKGAVVYDEKFIYSNHATDPASHQLCNAFDIVRLHKFGHEDDKAKIGTPSHRLPSFKEMSEWARGIKDVKADLIKNKVDLDASEFDVFADEDGGEAVKDDALWKRLQAREDGTVTPTFLNAILILRHDPKINKLMRFNELSQVPERAGDGEDGKGGEDWGDADSFKVREHVGAVYKVDFPERKIEDAILNQALKRRYHPIRDYLGELVWDGVRRLETVFIDYFECEDNQYVREAALCWFTAAVYRVFEPGYKFDTAIVIAGEQGIGKTSFLREIGKIEWYGELGTFEDKEGVEQTLGKWIIEITEMGATNKQAIEQQKSFLSACHTRTRLSYDRRAKDYKRQCVFGGTTNRDQYLKDSTGNRRWWPLDATVDDVDQEKLRGEVDQLWAEATQLYMADQTVLLSDEARIIAMGQQEDKREEDVWDGTITEWLKDDDYKDRYDTKYGSMDEDGGELEERKRVCIKEIWEDCLDKSKQIEPSRLDQNRIAAILNNNPKWEKHVSRDGKGASHRLRFGKRFGSQRAWVLSVTDTPF